MKIYSWNVNGIRAVQRKELLLPFINKHQPDVLCLQETKAQPDQIELDDLQGEYYITINSAERKGYSGTAILSRQEPLSVVRNIPDDIASRYNLDDKYGETNREGRVVAIELGSLWVVSVYTPNSKDDLSRIPMREMWDPAYLEFLRSLELKGKPVIACGDYNVAYSEDDLARPKPNVGKKGFTAEERAGFGQFLNSGYLDTLRLFKQGNGYYTWWSHWGKARENNVGWRIDYCLASESLAPEVVNADIHPDVLGSDHCPVSIELK